MKFKYIVLLFFFFATMLTSLWPSNIYLLFFFSLLSWGVLPSNRWWDDISISLLFFSIFYCLMQYMNIGIGSGFVILSILVAPVAFYRFGRWIMTWLNDEKTRLLFFFFTFLCFLLPLFLLTIEDMMLVGFVNESRFMLNSIGKEDSTLSATLYGLMSSTGIGFISVLFAQSLKNRPKIIFLTFSIMSILVVLHLVNRTGLVLLAVCILFSAIYTTKMRFSKIFPTTLILLFIIVIIINSGVISQDVLDAYMQRETRSTASAVELGGRSDLWNDAVFNLFIHPFGWDRVRYAHNLWLDLAAVGGWLALFPFLIASFKIVKNVIKITRSQVTPFRLVLLSTFVSMFFNSMVEPVIEGSLLFFFLFMMIWGMLKSVSQELNVSMK